MDPQVDLHVVSEMHYASRNTKDEEKRMPLFMTQFSYTPETWAALVKKPENREPQLKALIEKLGGRLIGLYYCFGEYDGVVIYEAVDENKAASGVLAAVAASHMKATKTTVLQSVADAMESWRNAGSMVYAGPKG